VIKKFIDRFKWHLAAEMYGTTNWSRGEISAAIERSISAALLDIAE